MKITPQLRRVQSARTTLLLDQPFFGVLALQLSLTEDTSAPTAWTDGSTIAFNPAFVDTLSQDELTAVLAHEVMHCACGHQWRREARDSKRWNVAADYAVNSILRDSGFKLPESALLSDTFNGKNAEWIYDRLPEGNDSDPNGDPNDGNEQGDPGTGEVRDAPADSPQTEADWQQIAKQAEKMAQAQGKMPGGTARAIDKLTAARVDWRAALRRFVQEVCKADYSWTRPNSRYVARGLYLPSLHSIACGKIVVAIDTSGSIDDTLLKQFGSECESIVSELQPSSVDVIYCDSEVQHVDTYERGEAVQVSPHGGGGTAFEPVFNHVAASGDTPAVLVYLTDLDGSFPDEAPDYPVIWCKAASGYRDSVPFGELIDASGDAS